MRKETLGILFALLCVAVPGYTHGASLTFVQDLISTSAPSATSTTHTIQFTATNAIPASGSVVITPQAGAFSIPAGLDYTDIDFAVSTGGPYVDRTLAGSATTAEDGVSVTTGSSGEITIQLNGTTGIAAGNSIQIEIGSNATSGETGDVFITNPGSTGSYRIGLETKDASDGVIDSATAVIVVLNQVGVSAVIDSRAPVRSNGLPSGEIAAGNASIEISLNTDESATCRYSTVSGTAYNDMTETLTSSGGGTIFYKTIGGHTDGNGYSYFVRCEDLEGDQNDDDFEISFSLKETPATGGGGGSGPSSSGPIVGGSQVLFLSSVTLSGWAPPLSTVTTLKDGVAAAVVQADISGVFTSTVAGLERGTYTFVVYADDSSGTRSASFSSTLTLESGSQNTISNLVLPPTIQLDTDTIVGDGSVRVFGNGVPGFPVEVSVRKQISTAQLGDAIVFETVGAQGVAGETEGSWEVIIDSSELSGDGTYQITAHTINDDQIRSGESGVLFLGLGESPSPDFSLRADINDDGKVNLVDFSIMLSFWNTNTPEQDINLDGNVDLADVSILLFYWTG